MGDITRAITQLQSDDEGAVELVWEQYFSKLCQYARSRISGKQQRIIDSEVIAATAMQILFDGLRHRRFDQVSNRDDLWRLLTCVASRKLFNARRFHNQEKRGGGKVHGDSVFSTAKFRNANCRARNDDPADIAEVESTWSTLLTRLPDEKYRKIATMRLAGISNIEISEHLHCTSRTVERKLNLIRKMLETINQGTAVRPR